MFLSSFAENYVGKAFSIECVNIEIFTKDDHGGPLFKGPGHIKGDLRGQLNYKVYNIINYNTNIINYMKLLKNENDQQLSMVRFKATGYDGVEWSGGWSVPVVHNFQSNFLFVTGKFNQLSTQVSKLDDDQKIDLTELVFFDDFELPMTDSVTLKHMHDDDAVMIECFLDHHRCIFEGTPILFQISPDKKRLHVEACHSDGFSPPYVENWITEALMFSVARVVFPRMVIRHFNDYAIVNIKATQIDSQTGMIPPFFWWNKYPEVREYFWQVFCLYLSKCKSTHSFEYLKITTGFYELCLASTGTLQGFLTSICLYIEYCIKEIFSGCVDIQNDGSLCKISTSDIIEYVKEWNGDNSVKDRSIGLLSNLSNPSIPHFIDVLIEEGVLTKKHKKIWKKVRSFLAHGNIIDFDRGKEFLTYRNYLFSMMYRLIFRLIGYNGPLLDYDGNDFCLQK